MHADRAWHLEISRFVHGASRWQSASSFAFCLEQMKLVKLGGNCAEPPTPCGRTTEPPAAGVRAEFQAKLGTVYEEADECLDHLEYLRDTRIRDDAALLQEARELAKIFAKSVSTPGRTPNECRSTRQANCLASAGCTCQLTFPLFHFFHFSTFAVDWPLWTPYISRDARLCSSQLRST